MKREPVLIIMSVLAALQFAAGLANLANLIGAHQAAWFVAAVAVVQAGLQFYVRNQVTPMAAALELTSESAPESAPEYVQKLPPVDRKQHPTT